MLTQRRPDLSGFHARRWSGGTSARLIEPCRWQPWPNEMKKNDLPNPELCQTRTSSKASRAAFGIEGLPGLDGEFHDTKTQPQTGKTRPASSKCAAERLCPSQQRRNRRRRKNADSCCRGDERRSRDKERGASQRGAKRDRTRRSELERSIQLEEGSQVARRRGWSVERTADGAG